VTTTKPPRVKVYGFLSLTRRQYLWSVIIALLLLIVLTPLWFGGGEVSVRQFVALRAPAVAPLVQYLPLLVALAVLIEAVEVVLVLRKFNQLELAQGRDRRRADKSTRS